MIDQTLTNTHTHVVCSIYRLVKLSVFRKDWHNKDFFDVTLECDDGQISVNKVILSTCSSFFFMFHGEVKVAQEYLNCFVADAEDLRVKGLTQGKDGGQTSHSAKPHLKPCRPKREETKQPVIPSSSSRVSLVPGKTETGQAHHKEAGAVGGEL